MENCFYLSLDTKIAYHENKEAAYFCNLRKKAQSLYHIGRMKISSILDKEK